MRFSAQSLQVAAVFLVAVAVAALRSGEDGALPAVVGGAVVAYTGLTWLLLRSAEHTRRTQDQRDAQARSAALHAARRDLKYGSERSHYLREWAHVPFQSAGIVLTRQRFIASLPPTLADAIETAAIRMAEFDTIAQYRNTHLETLQGSLDDGTKAAHAEAQEACRIAYSALDGYLDEEA